MYVPEHINVSPTRAHHDTAGVFTAKLPRCRPPPTMAFDPRQPRPENWFALSLVGLGVIFPLTTKVARRFKANERIMHNRRQRTILHV